METADGNHQVAQLTTDTMENVVVHFTDGETEQHGILVPVSQALEEGEVMAVGHGGENIIVKHHKQLQPIGARDATGEKTLRNVIFDGEKNLSF